MTWNANINNIMNGDIIQSGPYKLLNTQDEVTCPNSTIVLQRLQITWFKLLDGQLKLIDSGINDAYTQLVLLKTLSVQPMFFRRRYTLFNLSQELCVTLVCFLLHQKNSKCLKRYHWLVHNSALRSLFTYARSDSKDYHISSLSTRVLTRPVLLFCPENLKGVISLIFPKASITQILVFDYPFSRTPHGGPGTAEAYGSNG